MVPIIIVVIVLAISIAAIVYQKQVKAEKNPWPWTIATFILTAAILVVVFYAIILYAFGFER